MCFFVLFIVSIFFFIDKTTYSEENSTYKSNVGIEFRGYEKITKSEINVPNVISDSSQSIFPKTGESSGYLLETGILFIIVSFVICYKNLSFLETTNRKTEKNIILLGEKKVALQSFFEK